MYTNWSTWDVRCLNAIMKVPELVELRIAIYDDARKALVDEMLWDCVKRFGFKSIDGSSFEIDLKYENFEFNLKFTNAENGFIGMVTPLNSKQAYEHLKFFFAGLIRWNKEGKVEKKNHKILLGSDDQEWTVDFDGVIDEATNISANYQGMLFESSTPVIFRCNSTIPFSQVSNTIDESIERGMNETICSSGWLEDAASATVKGIGWNTIYEPIKKRFCTPVSRAWCSRPYDEPYYFGSYVLFAWDTFFAGLLSSLDSEAGACMQISSIIQEKNSRGMIPNFAAQTGSSLDRSQPPVGAYCVLKLYKQFNNKSLLESSYSALLEWNNWWVENRDGNHDGLLEWGSDCYENYKANTYEAFKERNGESFYGYPSYETNHNLKAACLESGLDNSHMYDDVTFNKQANTMELADIGLNSLYALDCWSLSEIAAILNDLHMAKHLHDRYNRMKKLINDNLWNDELGIYCNRHWNGQFSTRLSPTCFYPMIAGIATKERANIMVDRHLLNEGEFWGEYIIPSISKNDTAFLDNDYWRGRIWGPLNFLVSEGLKRYELYDVAYAFARKSMNLFLFEWRLENHIHENYNALSGDGDDVGLTADPVYTWGALLAYVGIGEIIEIQPWAELKIGNFTDEVAHVKNFPYQNRKLSVEKDKGLIVALDDQKFIEITIPVVITDFKIEGATVYMSLQTRGAGSLILYPVEGVTTVEVKLKDEIVKQVLENPRTVIHI